MYSVMWSEHVLLNDPDSTVYFGETMTEEMGSKIPRGIGENAGVVDIGGGNAGDLPS